MSTNNHPIEEYDLHAYVDGQLDALRREQVEKWLNDHPEDAERVQQYHQQNQAMHALFDPVLSKAVPDTLESPANQSQTQNRSQSSNLSPLRYAAMIGFMMVGGIIGYTMHDLAPVSGPVLDRNQAVATLPHQAAIAHVVYTPEVLHPVEVTAEQEAHLTKWLSKRLGTELRVPHLNPLGFNLVGGRLLPGDNGPAAQFMYENSAGKRLTLYVKHNQEKTNETAFRYDQQDGVSVFYWIDGPLGYALSGKIDKQALLNAANEVYRTINL